MAYKKLEKLKNRKDIDAISARDSRLSGQEIRRTIHLMVQWIRENPWEFEMEDNLQQKIQILEHDLRLQIDIAEAVEQAFLQSDRTPFDYQTILKTAALHLPDMISCDAADMDEEEW